MALVGEADRDQVGCRRREHGVDVGVRRAAVGRRAGRRTRGVTTDDGHQLGVGPAGEDARVLLAPHPGADHSHAQAGLHVTSS